MNTVSIILGIVFLLWIVGGIYKRIKGRNKIIHVVESRCTGCQRCVKKCRYNVLGVLKEEGKVRVVVKNPDRCSACGDCLGACKFNALELASKQTL
jgi:ferredoxin